MNFRMLIATAGLSVLMCSCSRTSDLAELELANQSSTSLTFRVESSSWPSRWVYFEPTKAAGMRAYSEPVYESIVEVRLTNVGASALTASYLAKEHRIGPNESFEFKDVKFADLRLEIAPTKDTSAYLTMELAFDRNYSSAESWRLVGVWSDGP